MGMEFVGLHVKDVFADKLFIIFMNWPTAGGADKHHKIKTMINTGGSEWRKGEKEQILGQSPEKVEVIECEGKWRV